MNLGAERPPTVSLRPALLEDRDFLQRVYASTRTEELAVAGWDDATKDAFLAQQFTAQDAHYRANYDNASFDIILVDDEPAGRLYVARWTDQIRLMDISLLPEFRSRGIGEHLVRALLDEARTAGKLVTIHVERGNRALSLYRRLGFEVIADKGVYVLMESRPSRSTKQTK